jgi:hypothetical protein
LFQEFDIEVIVKPGKLNARPDHLSRVTNGEEHTNLEDIFCNIPIHPKTEKSNFKSPFWTNLTSNPTLDNEDA